MCDTFGHPLYVSTCFDSIHFDPRHGSCPARIACTEWMDKFQKLLELERSIVRDRSIKFFPGPHWKRGKNFIGWVNTVNTTIGKAGLTHFLMEHLEEAGTRKKRPASRVFFFLPAFGRCCPSVSAHPANRTRCSSNIAIADHFPSKTFSFKHHLTGETSMLASDVPVQDTVIRLDPPSPKKTPSPGDRRLSTYRQLPKTIW